MDRWVGADGRGDVFRQPLMQWLWFHRLSQPTHVWFECTPLGVQCGYKYWTHGSGGAVVCPSRQLDRPGVRELTMVLVTVFGVLVILKGSQRLGEFVEVMLWFHLERVQQ